MLNQIQIVIVIKQIKETLSKRHQGETKDSDAKRKIKLYTLT